MRLMRFVNFFWLGMMLLFTLPVGAGDKAPEYTQSYTILIKGGLAGTENVSETVNEAGDVLSSSEHEIYVSDGLGTNRMAFTTKMLLAKNTYAPISYSYKYTSGDAGDSYEVAVKDAIIRRTLTRNGRASEVTASLQPNTVILDFNVYHQYDYLVRRYDVVKGGRQIFSDFVPLIGNDIQLAVTLMGDAELKYEKGAVAVTRYSVEFVGITSGTLSVDKNKRLVRLVIPAQDLEVVRKDLLPTGNVTN
jgi:hypothetical protein